MEHALVMRRHGYILSATLGEGSYGKVKSAYSVKLKARVAIKIVSGKSTPTDVLENFLPRELEIVPSMKHCNIVETLEIFKTFNRQVYIVMELCVHGDLLTFITSKEGLTEDISRRLFKQLCEAIQYMHDMKVVHRDIKCENLLLDKHYNLKVSDFGFSKRLKYEAGHMVLSKTYCGTMNYVAPEVLRNIPYNPKASDVWSMGVVLYMMLYGVMPYVESNMKKLLKMQTEHRVKFLTCKTISCEVKDVISRILHPVVKQRLKIKKIMKHPWLLSKEVAQKDSSKTCDELPTGSEKEQANDPDKGSPEKEMANDPDKGTSSAGASHDTPADV